MKFNIRGKKMRVTKPIKNYIEEKIGKLDKYFENPEEIIANIVVRVRGIEQIIEVTIPVKKIILRGEESHKDLYAAIDLVSEKIERQIRKNKKRMNKKNIKDNISGFMFDFDVEKSDSDGKIVKRKEIEMKPMSEEEAILQMTLLGHEFFVFRELNSGDICVLYQRKDNNYGIIKTN